MATKREELESHAIDLWNLATRSRRDGSQADVRVSGDVEYRNHAVGLLRVFSFLLLDSAGGHSVKNKERKNCIRLMKLALKAGRWCIENKAVDNATKVLVRAADYLEILGTEGETNDGAEFELGERLCVEYFALRTALVSTVTATRIFIILSKYRSTGVDIRSNGYCGAHVYQMQRAIPVLYLFTGGKHHRSILRNRQ